MFMQIKHFSFEQNGFLCDSEYNRIVSGVILDLVMQLNVPFLNVKVE